MSTDSFHDWRKLQTVELLNIFSSPDASLALCRHSVKTLGDVVASTFLLGISDTLESAVHSQFSAFCLPEYQQSLSLNSNSDLTGPAVGEYP